MVALSLAVSFGSKSSSSAQIAAAEKRLPLELRIEAEHAEKGVPAAFTVMLENRSDHDIRLPMPATDCASPFMGAIGVSFHFTPLRPDRLGQGHGCAGDTFDWPPILERVKNWKVLSPGDSLSIQQTASQIFCECNAPGKYEFWAGYTPPSLSEEDQAILREAGIEFPHQALESVHITYEKKH